MSEWGTDYWGEVLSEPSEDHARKVANIGECSVFYRGEDGRWREVPRG